MGEDFSYQAMDELYPDVDLNSKVDGTVERDREAHAEGLWIESGKFGAAMV